jgi:hypothetical protein
LKYKVFVRRVDQAGPATDRIDVVAVGVAYEGGK